MPTKIRLQRKGKKGKAFYHLVIADGRAPRDGKFIERLGTYNPNTNPATIEIDFDRSLYWVQVGAQPTDTARSILSREGVMFKDHLLRGVKKGAFTAEQAEEKFQAWVSEKASKLEQVTKNDELSEKELKKKRLEDERKVNEARAEALAKKLAKANAKDVAPAEEVAEEATEEAAKEQQDAPEAEAPKAEAPKAEAPKAEAPKAETPEAETPEADASEEAKKE